jgi:polysaccharide pyruvyl transferase WcaK-like protein
MSDDVPRYRRIGIWGHFNGGNQGDEIVVRILLDNVRARQPQAEIVGFSQNPADTEARYGIRSFPLSRGAALAPARSRASVAAGRDQRREKKEEPAPSSLKARVRRIPVVGNVAGVGSRLLYRTRSAMRSLVSLASEPAFLIRSYRALAAVDLLVVAGSGPIFDAWGGPWSHPWNLFKWTLLARATKTRIIMISVGAGPIEAPLSEFFLRYTLRHVEYVSYRDESSAALGAALTPSGRGPAMPDQAFGLEVEPRSARSGDDRLVVGVNAMAHQDSRYVPGGQQALFEAFRGKLTEFVAWLIDEGHEVRWLSSQVSADPRVCAEIEEELVRTGHLAEGKTLAQRDIFDSSDFVEEVSCCDLVVASRFHGCLIPSVLCIPVIGLAYGTKTFDLLEYIGQGDYAIDIDEFEVSDLIDLFQRLRGRRHDISRVLGERIPRCREAISSQYDTLFGPVVNE